MALLELDEFGRRIYEPDGVELAKYLLDRKRVSVIRGPIGSGSSSASCYKIALLATEQAPWPDGIRRTRWFVVRNTYSELRDTTLATWLFWFPEETYGTLVRSRPMIHRMRWADVECDVYFLALDNDDDVKKLRSFEFTGGWFNEVEYIPKSIFDEGESRTGRYPPAGVGGPTWSGVIADMNAPNEDHWIPQMTREAPYPDEVPEDKRVYWPDDWSYFVQPPALIEVFGSDKKRVVGYLPNPMAENRKWLKEGYYEEKLVGKSKQWIDSRLMNRITFLVDGDPVWPMFVRETHVAPRPIDWVTTHGLVVALDFGRRPTALVGQEIGNRLYVLAEFRMYGVGATTFAPALKRWLDQRFPGASIRFVGDPKGQDKGQADERTAYDVFRANGMSVTPAPVKNNNIETRIQAVEHILQDMWQGQPRLIIDPVSCPTLVAGMSGKYCLVMEAGEPTPQKRGPNAKFSDVCDCLQYMCIFLGEGVRLSGGDPRALPRSANVQRGQKSLRRV